MGHFNSPNRLLVSCLFGLMITSNLTAEEEEATTQRISTGLQVFYDFHGEGPIIRNRSGTGKSLDLRIGEMKSVRRGSGSIEISGEAKIVSQNAAAKIIQATKRSGELTVEAWIQPSQRDQSGPARIVTLSKDSSQRNFTLGQDGSKYEVRFRSKSSSTNGLPSLPSTAGTAREGRLTHIAYTRTRNGQARIYVDGEPAGRVTQTGGLNNWNESFKLGIGDEISGGRVWRGTLHLVAVYSRALGNAEVRRNFAAGHNAGIGNSDATGDPLTTAQNRRVAFFETKIAPLLAQHCLECHDSAAHEGGLNLSRKIPALAGGESGKALIPGNSSESLLWASVADDSMPHDREPLTDDQKQILRQWIDDGAHWSVDYVDPAIYRSVHESENWIKRLTIPEYIESVRSTLGVDIAEEARKRLPQDKRADGFRNTAYNLNVDLKHIEAYARLAEIIVAQVDTAKFARRFSKSRKLTDDNMRDLIRDMGKWVLRGPLEEHEVVLYRGVSTTVASAGGDFPEAVGMVLEAMLQSPKFLYRMENQVGDGTWWPIDEYELANRISYIVWGAPPDDELLQAAEQGDLSYPETLQPHLDRMMKDPRAKQRSDEFVIQWLNLDRLRDLQPNREKFPQWSQKLADDMRAETLEFFRDVVWKQRALLPICSMRISPT